MSSGARPADSLLVDGGPAAGVAALELRNVHTYYGHIHAIKGVSLRVEPGEIVTLIGANGAGKTTTLRTISGIIHPREGEVLLNGQRIDRVAPHHIVEMGICQSPEGRRIFSRMTRARKSGDGRVRAARHGRADSSRTSSGFSSCSRGCGSACKQRGGTLSGGEQQMLAMGGR